MPSQRKYALYTLLTVAVCVMALYIHRHRQGQTGRIDNFLISITGGFQEHFFYFGAGTRTIADHYLLLVNTKKHNEELEKDLAFLKNRLTSLQDVELENNRLREALSFKGKIAQPLSSAHAIAHDVSTDYVGIRIDRGSESGVQLGMGVISPRGVVGRILRVTPKYSDVITLIDPTSNVDAIIQRSRARGIVSGQMKQMNCRLKYVDRLEDVVVDDVVVSSGFGNVFPKGLLVGYVSTVATNPTGILQSISIRPAVEIYRLEEVLIVFPSTEPSKAAE